MNDYIKCYSGTTDNGDAITLRHHIESHGNKEYQLRDINGNIVGQTMQARR
jgi:hypothetical protein